MMLQRFFKDRRASVVPIFALSAIPLVGLVGAAVDYSRASAVRAALQAAADTTALAVGVEMSKAGSALTAAGVPDFASNYFKAVFTRTDAQDLTVHTTYSNANGSQVVVTGSASVKTAFMGILGVTTIDVAGSSTSTWGDTKLRVALVLDNTGSMSQYGKLSALKTATTNLLSQLQSAATNPGDVYVSIVPFVKDVNVGAANYTASWIDWTYWDAANGSCKGYKNYYGHGSPSNQSTCLSYSGTWTPNSHSTWNGCVMDRDQNYDTTNTSPPAGPAFPAEQYSSCPLSLVAQTYDWTALNNEVNAMTAAGSTNQTIGLVWGWQTLTQGAPLNAPALDPNYKYQQVIILLTDGLNTQDRWYGNGSSTSTQVDARMNLACGNIKNAGITIYTVQVNTDGDPTSTLLQNCASSTPGTNDHFFLLTSASQIITTFNQIGTNLSKLRLAR